MKYRVTTECRVAHPANYKEPQVAFKPGVYEMGSHPEWAVRRMAELGYAVPADQDEDAEAKAKADAEMEALAKDQAEKLAKEDAAAAEAAAAKKAEEEKAAAMKAAAASKNATKAGK